MANDWSCIFNRQTGRRQSETVINLVVLNVFAAKRLKRVKCRRRHGGHVTSARSRVGPSHARERRDDVILFVT